MIFDDAWMRRLADDYERAAVARHRADEDAFLVVHGDDLENCPTAICKAATGRIQTIRAGVR